MTTPGDEALGQGVDNSPAAAAPGLANPSTVVALEDPKSQKEQVLRLVEEDELRGLVLGDYYQLLDMKWWKKWYVLLPSFPAQRLPIDHNLLVSKQFYFELEDHARRRVELSTLSSR